MNLTFDWHYFANNLNYNLKRLVRHVKTKKFVTRTHSHLHRVKDRLTSAGANRRHCIHSLLDSAYGANISEQVIERLSDQDINRIRDNILFN